MTEREKAIVELRYMKQYFYYADSRKAIDVAMEALKEEPRYKGCWQEETDPTSLARYFCPFCGHRESSPYTKRNVKFCPVCGADMRGEKNEQTV